MLYATTVRWISFLVVTVALVSTTAGGLSARCRLDRVVLKEPGTEGEWLSLVTTQPPDYTSFKLTGPARIVVDFPETVVRARREDGPADGPIASWTTESLGNGDRIVGRLIVELRKDADYTLTPVDGAVELHLVPAAARPLVALGGDEQPPNVPPLPPASKKPSQAAVPPPEATHPLIAQAPVAHPPEVVAAAPAPPRADDGAPASTRPPVQVQRTQPPTDQHAKATAARQERFARAAAEQERRRQAEQERRESIERAQRQRAERLAAEQAKRAAAWKARQEKIEQARRERREQIAAEQARHLAALKARREKATAEQARHLAALKARHERAAAEKAKRLAAWRARREQAAAKRLAALRERREATHEARAPARATLSRIAFRRVRSEAEVILRTTDPVAFSTREMGPQQIVLDLEHTRITLENNRRELDTQYFGTAVNRIVPHENRGAGRVSIEVDLAAPVPYEVKNDGTTLTMIFHALGPAGAQAQGESGSGLIAAP